MSSFSILQIPPPSNWQDFEILCCDLWREIWKDPNTQRNGRQGQPQHGIDVYGRLNAGDSWAGVQCKGKDSYTDKSLTKDEVKGEVEKAKSFQPHISQFIIATTGHKDAKIEELARTITHNHIKSGLFSIHVWSWPDIICRLEDFPSVIEKHFPQFNLSTRVSKKDTDELKEMTQTILKKTTKIEEYLPSLSQEININHTPGYTADISTTILTTEYQAEVDHSKDLLHNFKPSEALAYLLKLKERIWSSAPLIVKYRILTNIGSAKLNLQNEQEAAKLFIEALQYNPEDEKALCNASLGNLFLCNVEESKTLANKALSKNPVSKHAYSILIQTFSDKDDLKDIIEKVPEACRNSIEVAYAFSNLARKRNDLVESKEWLEIAIAAKEKVHPDILATMGSLLLEFILKDQSILYGNQVKEEQREQINQVISYLSTAWDLLGDDGIRKKKISWIVNRGYAKRLSGDFQGAIKDIDYLLELESSNPTLKKHRAVLAYETNDNDKAIQILKEILTCEETPEAPMLLSEVLRKIGAYDEAIRVITDHKDREMPAYVKEEINRLLIQLFIDIQDYKAARKISDNRCAEYPTSILNLVDVARISIASGNENEAIAVLKDSVKNITESSQFRELVELADEFYNLEQFEDAVIIYEKIINKTIDTPLSRKLLNSYYRSGDIGKALEQSKLLISQSGPQRYLSEMQSAIYEQIGYLVEAKKVCEEYLSRFPDDFPMKLRLAVVNLRSNNIEELDKFLNSSEINIIDLPLEYNHQLAFLYAYRNLTQRALEILYESRRKFFNDGYAHLRYMTCFFQEKKGYEEWLNPTEVSKDTAACIRDESGQQQWYILEERGDADIARKEINMDHPLTRKLIGKKKGDEIILKDTLSQEIGTIIEIKSKYVYALHESTAQFEKLFPEIPGFWEVKVELTEKKEGMPIGLDIVFGEISKQHDITKKVESFYKKGNLTIGAFAKLVGRNVLDVWGGMTINPDLGFKCCNGNVNERISATTLLRNDSKLIIDIISIMTISGIKAGDIIVNTFGKLGISQSTIDLLQQSIYKKKAFLPNGYMTISKHGDEFFREEVSSEDVQRTIDNLEEIMEWIETNCEVIPCKTALSISRARKDQLDGLFGISFIDTVLIASEVGNILFSDDERLRSYAMVEFNVDGIWTQPILMHCVDIGNIDKAIYNEMVVKLYCSNYYHTSIDADVLIEAVRQSEWKPIHPFTTVLQNLRGKNSDESSSLNVSINFLFELWKQPIIGSQRDYLIVNLLDTITLERTRKRTLNKLVALIQNRFKLLPLAERELVSLITAWQQTHIV